MAALGFGRVWAWFGVRGSIKAGWCRVQYTSMQQAICMVHYGLWREERKVSSIDIKRVIGHCRYSSFLH
jgi:hypothetical protein|eukprot:scaffold2713_cov253-Chaetoceros_neogracile.AAC.4